MLRFTQHSDDPDGEPVDPHGRPHPEEYQNLYHEASWAALHRAALNCGVRLYWNMFDFASDSRREGDLTDINEKDLVRYDRKVRKELHYLLPRQLELAADVAFGRASIC